MKIKYNAFADTSSSFLTVISRLICKILLNILGCCHVPEMMRGYFCDVTKATVSICCCTLYVEKTTSSAVLSGR